MTIGERISKLIKDKRISPYKLSKDTFLAQTSISNWISGVKKPNKASINLLAFYFNVPFKWLWEGKNELTPIVEYLPNDLPIIIDDAPKNYLCPNCLRLQSNFDLLNNLLSQRDTEIARLNQEIGRLKPLESDVKNGKAS